MLSRMGWQRAFSFHHEKPFESLIRNSKRWVAGSSLHTQTKSASGCTYAAVLSLADYPLSDRSKCENKVLNQQTQEPVPCAARVRAAFDRNDQNQFVWVIRHFEDHTCNCDRPTNARKKMVNDICVNNDVPVKALSAAKLRSHMISKYGTSVSKRTVRKWYRYTCTLISVLLPIGQVSRIKTLWNDEAPAESSEWSLLQPFLQNVNIKPVPSTD